MPREHQFPFELRHLIYFHEVARTLHFNRAAQALAITQPSLSRQIRQLEDALGVELLNRNSRKVELTAEGRFIAEQCVRLLPKMHEIVTEVHELAKGEGGLLRLMFTSLAMANVLPQILSEFAKSRPKARIDLEEGGTESQLRAISNGQADCGFCHPEALPHGLSAKELFEEPIGIVLPKEHLLATKAYLEPEQLKNEDFVLFPERDNPLLYRRILQFLRSFRFEPRVRQEQTNRVNRVALVAAGMGVTYACASEASVLPAETVFRPLKDRQFVIKTSAVWSSETNAPLLVHFAKLVRSARICNVKPCFPTSNSSASFVNGTPRQT